jgi:hypothetical protein
VAWLGGEATSGLFQPATAPVNLMGRAIVQTITTATRAAADLKNVTVATGLWGAAFGLALGLAGGMFRRSWAAAQRAALAGLLLGALLGSVAALALVPLYYHFFRDVVPQGLLGPMSIHAGIYSAIGAAGGLALGWGIGRNRALRVRALIGGLLGGVLGAVVAELIGAWAFPLAKTYQPQATKWGARLLARLAVAILAAAGAAAAVADMRRSESSASPSR